MKLKLEDKRLINIIANGINFGQSINNTESKVEGFKYLTGGFSNTLVTGGLDAVGGTSQQSIMYPLQFWFCRNIGLALPLIALQYHEVKLQFMWGSGAAGSGISRSTAECCNT